MISVEKAAGEPQREKRAPAGDRQVQMNTPDSGDFCKTPVTMEAFCENIIFRNSENGYSVVLFSGKDVSGAASEDLTFTAVGSMPFLEPGDYALLSGRWVVHSSYGQQLLVDHYTHVTPHTAEDIYHYLSSSSVQGIGEKTAQRIVQAFGEDSIKVMREDPKKLAQIRGITLKKARQISASMMEKGEFQELSLLLTPFGLGMGRILSIYKLFGASAQFVVKNNPFRLADEVTGIGFRTADALASFFGCDPASPYRIISALMYCMTQAENEGHTYLPLDTLLKRAQVLLSAETPDGQSAGYSQLLTTRRAAAYSISPDGDFLLAGAEDLGGSIRVALPQTLEAEIASAKIIAGKVQWGVVFSDSEEIGKKLSDAAEQLGIELAPEQKKAVLTAGNSYVSIITGGPGTGKTTIIRVLTDYFQSVGKKAVLCAPTGRAAKRMSEASGIPASTIHRLLEMDRSAEGSAAIVFKRNEENPLEADAIVVDEASMLDTNLFCCLLKAVSSKTQIIFVGDSDQLPSVGSGNVLADMIQSGAIPVVRLTQIFRQASQSGIVQNAHRILGGQPILFDQSIASDCMLISMETAPQIAQAVVKLCSQVLPNIYGIDVLRDAAVLSPSRKGPAGINALNPLLQAAAENEGEPHIASRGFSYRIRDKVMQTRNNYDLSYRNQDGTQGLGVFNGELGLVIKADRDLDCLTVEMDDGRFVLYDRTAMDDLEPAYAMTVHKSQGSEYPVVILAVAPGSPMLNNRNLLYTAITRARKKLFIVSSRATLEKMIHCHAQNSRRTSLCEFLRIYAKGGG